MEHPIAAVTADGTPGKLSAAAPRRRRRSTMAQDAVAELRELIIFGSIPPGAPLRLEELAAALDMSISPVREAIRHLETMGLAEHVPYRGARVTNIDATQMHDVYEVRLALESAAVRRAAIRFDESSDSLVSAALELLEAGYRDGDPRQIVHGNTAFHASIAIASGSSWLDRFIRPTLDASERFSASLLQGREEATIAVERRGHEEIAAACRARDPDGAEAALRRHLGTFEELFASALGANTSF
jgi:DNA-binding GntR family transcriptional regulator